MKLTEELLRYYDEHEQEAIDLLIELAQIPAPSHHEEKRAEFCKNWLEQQGAKGVCIDEALNVVYPVGDTGSNKLMVFEAHSDVVFPDMEPLPLKVEDGRIHCPGVGDDTTHVVAMLMTAKYIAQNNLQPKDAGVLIVVNSCEEGLGNLKGTRAIFERYGDRVEEFITFDAFAGRGADRAVGSKRYKVEIATEGGHSYGAFGNRNAIAYMASLIGDLYNIKVPARGKTTYNVGKISGGTSVNTIAQNAEMLYEFRSDDREDLAEMETHFNAAIDFYRTKGIEVKVTLVGDRPCSGEFDLAKQQKMKERVNAAYKEYYGVEETVYHAGSTDCNIPLSMGIPALSVGCKKGAGTHTRGEYVEIDSLLPGHKVAAELILYHF